MYDVRAISDPSMKLRYCGQTIVRSTGENLGEVDEMEDLVKMTMPFSWNETTSIEQNEKVVHPG